MHALYMLLGIKERINTNDIVKKNTQVTIGENSSINDFNKYQLDMLVYTYPYHMQKGDQMKPLDCQEPLIYQII